jgi:hypothetical protein
MHFIQGNIRPSEGISYALYRIMDFSTLGEGKGKGDTRARPHHLNLVMAP